MMQDLYWECRMCEACGVCARTENQCEIYTKYYSLEKKQIVDSQEAISQIVTYNRGLIDCLKGQIVKVVVDDVLVQLTIKIGDNYVSSIMSLKEFEDTGKNEGDTVTAIFEASNIKMIL